MSLYISPRISLATQNRIEVGLLRTLIAGCRLLPRRWVLALGERVGRLAWRAQLRRRTVLTNLRLAFGEKLDDAAREEVAERCYRHFGREIFHTFILDRDARRPLEDWIEVEGIELLQNREGRGAIVVGGHLGYWELVGIVLPRLGVPVTIYTGRHQNRRADALLNRLRVAGGAETLSRDDDREELLKRARTGIVALAGDQRPHKAPVMVEFFGRPTQAAQGPAAIALVNKIDFIFSACIREGERYRIRFERVEYPVSESRRENIKRLTQAYFTRLQREIERHPEQYFWMHRRWKNEKNLDYEGVETMFGKSAAGTGA